MYVYKMIPEVPRIKSYFVNESKKKKKKVLKTTHIMLWKLI